MPDINNEKPVIYNKFHKIDNHLIQLLSTERFYCANYQELNDPYDCRPQFSEGFIKGIFEGNIDSYIRGDVNHKIDDIFYEFMSNMYSGYPREDIKTLSTSKKILFIMDEYEEFVGVLLKYIGHNIVGFTVNIDLTPEDIMMWAHYSQNSKGVKLKFNFNENLGNHNILPFLEKVNYDLPSEVNSVKELHNQIFIKSPIWSYENEYRMITNKNKFIVFEPGMLRHMMFGYNVPLNDRNAIIRIAHKLGYYHCKYFQMKFVRGKLEKVPIVLNPNNDFQIDGKSIKRIDY